MSTTPPPPFPPATGPVPTPPPASSRSPWLGVGIGAVVGVVIAVLVGVLVIQGDDDDDPVAAGPTTTEAAPTATTEPDDEDDDTTTTTEDDDRPGGLSPVAEEAGAMVTEAFDATPEQEECMWDAFADNPELFQTLDEEALESDPDAMLEIITVAKDCLDADELATTFAEGMMEGSDLALSPDQAACLSEELLADDELLVTLLYLGTNPDYAPETAQVASLWSLLGACDLGELLAADLVADNPSMTEEHAACVVDGMFELEASVVQELWQSGNDPGYQPSDEAMSAMFELFLTCDVPLMGEFDTTGTAVPAS